MSKRGIFLAAKHKRYAYQPNDDNLPEQPMAKKNRPKKTKYVRSTPTQLLREDSMFNLRTKLQESLTEVLLSRDFDYFRNLPNAKTIETEDGPAIFIDNGADILAVGHLDYVDWSDKPTIDFKQMTVSNCFQLDDRLGVWVILHLLPHLYPDLKYDILLCDSEEVGRSTAKDWEFGDKKYNFGFEFDRAGIDAVTYEYSDKHWDEAVSEFVSLGRGAFSDICYLERLGCKMVNVGTGYYDQHSAWCWADLEETIIIANAFGKWATENQNVHFPHVETPSSKWRTGGSNGSTAFDFGDNDRYRSNYDDIDWENYKDWDKCCEVCGALTNQVILCRDCQENAADTLYYELT